MITGAWVTMHADDKAFSGFQFTFNSEQKLILNDVMVGTRDQNFGIIEDYLVLELKSVTPRLTGRILPRIRWWIWDRRRSGSI